MKITAWSPKPSHSVASGIHAMPASATENRSSGEKNAEAHRLAPRAMPNGIAVTTASTLPIATRRRLAPTCWARSPLVHMSTNARATSVICGKIRISTPVAPTTTAQITPSAMNGTTNQKAAASRRDSCLPRRPRDRDAITVRSRPGSVRRACVLRLGALEDVIGTDLRGVRDLREVAEQVGLLLHDAQDVLRREVLVDVERVVDGSLVGQELHERVEGQVVAGREARVELFDVVLHGLLGHLELGPGYPADDRLGGLVGILPHPLVGGGPCAEERVDNVVIGHGSQITAASRPPVSSATPMSGGAVLMISMSPAATPASCRTPSRYRWLIEPIDTPTRLPARVDRSSASIPEPSVATIAIVSSMPSWLE